MKKQQINAIIVLTVLSVIVLGAKIGFWIVLWWLGLKFLPTTLCILFLTPVTLIRVINILCKSPTFVNLVKEKIS
jgi:hypothetical protein